jgi:hypothetical protein
MHLARVGPDERMNATMSATPDGDEVNEHQSIA